MVLYFSNFNLSFKANLLFGVHSVEIFCLAVVNLTLIDLPGLTKVAVGNLPLSHF